MLLVAVAIFFTSACRQQMADQPRYDPLEKSDFFADGQASRPLVEGTVARGELREDTELYTGKVGDQPTTNFPFPITKEIVERGRDRFNIYCAVCHDRLGTGNGMVVQRGFRRPPSYYAERLRKEPVGHYFDVITNGFGAMSGYAPQVKVRDRWAIIAYIRALQLSQPTLKGEDNATPVLNTPATPSPTTTHSAEGTPAGAAATVGEHGSEKTESGGQR